jgi:membrane-associated phospholipid phosphatase
MGMEERSPLDESPTLARGIWQAVLLAIIMFSSLGGYLIVLKWRGPQAGVTTWIPADDWFPMWPSWVWVYLIPYVLGPLFIGMLTPRTFRWYVIRGLVLVGITLVIFIIFPTQTDQESRVKVQQVAGEGFTAKVHRDMIEIDDPPANAAPSLHVSLTCLLALAMIRDFPRWWPLWFAFVGSVWLSTLVTRQHHLIDVATGTLLTWLVVWLFYRFQH